VVRAGQATLNFSCYLQQNFVSISSGCGRTQQQSTTSLSRRTLCVSITKTLKLMIKIIFPVIFALTTMQSFAQVDNKPNDIVSTQNNITVSYRLFATQNMWTFIKLDTRNGQMWQVQFDVQGSNRSVIILNSISLVTKENEVNDRFTLYPTQNIYNFILIDQLDGRTWQVQWSTNEKNRGIIPIE
jgi:hypothetical protein